MDTLRAHGFRGPLLQQSLSGVAHGLIDTRPSW
jgi:hypothetical protein